MQDIVKSKDLIKNIAGVRLLYVMAAKAEYGHALAARITPFICHVGPVEAALNVADFLAQHEVDLVVSLGSAGSDVLQQAEVYQVSHVSYRDMDVSAFGFAKGETPFLSLPVEVALGHPIAGLKQARISTGGQVISGVGYQTIDADMVDMETWAVMRACQQRRIPLIGLRGISDGAEPVAGYSDWTRYLKVIDERLAQAVDGLEKALQEGTLSPIFKSPHY